MRNNSGLGQLQTPGYRPLPNPQQVQQLPPQQQVLIAPPAPLPPRAEQAKEYLRYGLGIAAVLAGGDKLLGISHEWEQYVSPQVRSLGIPTSKLLKILGGMEIVAGLVTMAEPGLGAKAIASLTLGNMINVAFTGRHWDIIIRDLGLLFTCIGLAKLDPDV